MYNKQVPPYHNYFLWLFTASKSNIKWAKINSTMRVCSMGESYFKANQVAHGVLTHPFQHCTSWNTALSVKSKMETPKLPKGYKNGSSVDLGAPSNFCYKRILN